MANFAQIKRFLNEAVVVPELDGTAYQRWIRCQEVIPFLSRLTSGDIPVLVTGRSAYIYGMLVPSNLIRDDYRDRLKEWNFNPIKGWVFWVDSNSDGEPVGIIDKPETFTHSDILDAGEPIVFLRHTELRDPPSYPEVNQKILHSVRAHWLPDRGAISRINQHGDVIDVIVTERLDDGQLCTFEADALDEYMFATDQSLVLLFDFGRSRHPDGRRSNSTDLTEEAEELNLTNGYARLELDLTPEHIEESRLRGFLVFSELDGRSELIRRYSPDNGPRIPFIIEDWKHGLVRTYPGERVTPPDTPVEEDWPDLISPAFFRAEVMAKYQADPAKYTDTGESITCRGSWSLRSYDVNVAGQIHVYLKDLWDLPRSEQEYWKLFNERPKAGISERAIARDFEARWWDGFDPLRDLKQLLASYPSASHHGKDAAIWSPGSSNIEDLFAPLRYVLTESRKEWLDQILALSRVVIEGLSSSHLKAVAQALGCDSSELRSIGLLKACLLSMGLAEDDVIAIHDPLHELNRLRSRAGGAHRGSAGPQSYYKVHFENLLNEVTEAMNKLARLIEEGRFNLPL